jgi:hypothetical protein
MTIFRQYWSKIKLLSMTSIENKLFLTITGGRLILTVVDPTSSKVNGLNDGR